MKAKEFEIKKRDPNWRAMQDIRRSGAGGQHKDKKKAEKQGEVKHKGKVMAEGADELYGLRIGDTVTAKVDGQRVQGDIIDIFPDDMEVELLLRGPETGRTVVVDVRDTEIVEATGDEKFDAMMRTIKKGTKKQATADRREREAESRKKARDAFGPSPADRLSIRSGKDMAEAETNWSSGKGGGNDFFRDVSGMQNPRSAIKMIKDGMRGMYGDEIAGKLLRGYDDWAAHIGSDDINDVAKAMLPGIKKAWSTRNKRTVKDIGKKSYSPPKERDRVYWDGDEDVAEGSEPDERYLDKVISDLHKDAFGARPDHEFGREWMSSSYEEKLRIFKNMLKSLHNGMDEDYRDRLQQMRQNTQDKLAGMRSNTQSTLGRLSGRDKPASATTGGRKTPKVGDKIEFGQFNKPDSMKTATVIKVNGGGMSLVVKTNDGKEGTINLGNKSLALKILEDDGTITQNLPFGSVKLSKPDPVSSRPGLQQRPGSEKEKESMPPKIKRLWDRIKQEPKIWAEVMNIIDEFDTLRDDEIEDEINAFLSSDTLMMRAVGIVLQYEHEKMKNESVREDSDWGEPREILEDVLRTLEREVEWPLTEVMDPKQVRQLLAPIVRAVNDKLLSMDRDGNQ